MAVTPGRMFSGRSARRVEQALLCQQHEWSLGTLAVADCAFRCSDLDECAAKMNCPGARTVGCGPWDRAVERPVDLKDPWTVSIAFELVPITIGQPLARDLYDLARRQVEENGAGGWQVGERIDACCRHDLPAERA